MTGGTTTAILPSAGARAAAGKGEGSYPWENTPVLAPRPMSRLTFLHIVSVPLRNLHHLRPRLLNNPLATQPRVQLHIRRRLHPVQLLVLRLTEPPHPFLHPDMAGRASTHPTTRM